MHLLRDGLTKNLSSSPFFLMFIGKGNKEMQTRYNDELIEDQVLHVGKKIGQNYNIVTTPDPWVAKMIFHHSKPGGGPELVFDGKDGLLV